MDCLLIHTPRFSNYYRLFGKYIFPMDIAMGLFPMADLLSRNGHETQILHLGIERITSKSFSIQAYIKETRPQIIGLSMHWHHQCQEVRLLFSNS